MSGDHSIGARIEAIHTLHGVRAGSALLRVGHELLAVQDDAWSVAWISLPDIAIRMQTLDGDGQALTKIQRPDFEAAMCDSNGGVWLLGSGSTPARCAIVRIDPIMTEVSIRKLPMLYEFIADALELPGRSNIEAGILLDHNRCRLFHRGVGSEPSASIDVPVESLDGAAPAMLGREQYILGSVNGTALQLSEACRLDDGRIVFLAVSESTGDAINDGPVAGSVIGVIDSGSTHGCRTLRTTPLLEPDGAPSLRKPEGLVIDPDCLNAWIITDPDSTSLPAELCRVSLNGFS